MFTLPAHHGASLPFCTGTAQVFASTVNTSSARREGTAAGQDNSALADCDSSADAADVASTVTATVTFSVPLVHAVNWGSPTVCVMVQVKEALASSDVCVQSAAAAADADVTFTALTAAASVLVTLSVQEMSWPAAGSERQQHKG